jgi:sterol desaturase/sphingolipid hydroxylase (fatty acid hydroxylase superfamily)
MAFFVSYLFYPLLLLATLGLFVPSVSMGWDLARVFMAMAGVRFALLLGVEFLHPARPEWRMTWPSFRRDLKSMAVNGGAAGLLKVGFGWLALDLSRFNTGVVAGMPMVVEFIGLLLTFEFFQYWYHRLSHEGRGRFPGFNWSSQHPCRVRKIPRPRTPRPESSSRAPCAACC